MSAAARVDVVDDDRRALRREPLGDRPADALPGAGDQRDAARDAVELHARRHTTAPAFGDTTWPTRLWLVGVAARTPPSPRSRAA